MELQRAGQALLRSSRTITEYVVSASSRPRCSRSSSVIISQNSQNSNLRQFMSSTRLHQQAAAASPPPDNTDKPNELRPTERSAYGLPTGRTPDDFDRMLRRHSQSSTAPTPTSNTASTARAAFQDTQYSWANNRRSPSQFGTNFSPIKPAQKSIQGPLDFAELLDPRKPVKGSGAQSIMVGRQDEVVYPRLGPVIGRSVDVKNNDVRQALIALNMLMGRNSIKNLWHRQRFHERQGLKRKRLKSERWRKRFKEGFEHVTKRVNRFVNQGW